MGAEKICSRYGGNFSDGKTAALREPLGIVVLDPEDGKSVYTVDEPMNRVLPFKGKNTVVAYQF